MSGLPIGGLLSSISVAIVLAYSEMQYFIHRPRSSISAAEQLFIMRYVDDVLAISGSLCAACLRAEILSIYPVKLSVVEPTFSSPSMYVDTLSVASHHWTDVDICNNLSSFGISVRPHNPNRAWISGRGDRQRLTLITWPGRPPASLASFRSIASSRVKRAYACGADDACLTMTILELATELIMLNYPLSFVRAILHSLPPSPAALRARQLYRSWRVMAKSNGKSSNNNADKDKSFRQGSDKDGDRHRRRRRSSKGSSRRSSSSSSSSDSEADRKRLQKLQKRMQKADPKYKEYLAAQEKAEVESASRAQADALARALEGSFDKLWDRFETKPATTSVAVVHPHLPAGPAQQAGAAVAGAVPPFPPVPPVPPVPERPRLRAEAEAPTGDPDRLSQVQLALLSAEFGHKIKVLDTNGHKDAVVTALMSAFKAQQHAKLTPQIFKRFNSTTPMPTKLKDRAEAMFVLFQQM